MSWWGKLIGGAFGFMLGGPLGAMLGAAIGHNLDKGLDSFGREQLGVGDTERIQQAFFAATFSIMGHLAKADGRVSEHEIELARLVMDRMQLSEEQKLAAMELFNQGKREDFPLDDVMEQFNRECRHRRNLLQMFLEIQIGTVLADGHIHQKERARLHHLAQKLGFSAFDIDYLIEMVQAQQYYAAGGRGSYRTGTQTQRQDLSQAYKVLGVEVDASDREVKTAYRRLMSQHHPDKLVARGLPEEMMKLATEKTQEIKAAYEEIKSARKL